MLKLRAEDITDLEVLSAALQDAIVPVSDIAYLPDEKRFVFVANRFRWEKDKGDNIEYERTHCGVTVEGVTAVQRRSLHLSERGRLLNLLSITADKESLLLTFSGNIAIRLESPRWTVLLADMGAPWPTVHHPEHPLDAGADKQR